MGSLQLLTPDKGGASLDSYAYPGGAGSQVRHPAGQRHHRQPYKVAALVSRVTQSCGVGGLMIKNAKRIDESSGFGVASFFSVSLSDLNLMV